MSEWVLKGSLKGPQGDPGQDAQLPAGGTEGQVLTKTSGGEAWADVPQPDMTGVVKWDSSSHKLSSDGDEIDAIRLGLVSQVAITSSSVAAASITSNMVVVISVDESGTPNLQMGSVYGPKSVNSITDDATSGDTSALATAKAVKDYADAHAMPSVVPISQGGTGATTADGARTALGISVADPTELVEYVKSKLGGA